MVTLLRLRGGLSTLLIGGLLSLSCNSGVEPSTGPQPTKPKLPVEPGESAPFPTPAPAGRAVETTESDVPAAHFPTFGVAFDPPEGWTADTTIAQAGFLGRWVADTSNPDDWRQLTVDVRPLPPNTQQSLAAASGPARVLMARGYARARGGLDGVAADRFEAPPGDPAVPRQPTPSPIFVTQHEGRAYRLIFLFNNPEAEAADVIDRVAASWRWLSAEPVATHLGLGDPHTLFHGLGSIRLPATARSDPEFTTNAAEAYTVFDYARGQDAIILVLERDSQPEPAELREHVIAYSQRVEQRTQLDRTLVFNRLGDREDLYASDVLEGRFEQENRTVARVCRYAVWRPRPGTLVRVQAVVNNEVFATQKELQAALSAVNASLLSLRSPPSAR